MILSIKTDQLNKYMEHADYKIYRGWTTNMM